LEPFLKVELKRLVAENERVAEGEGKASNGGERRKTASVAGNVDESRRAERPAASRIASTSIA